MKEIRDLLKKAYSTTLAKDVCRETEADLRDFEETHGIALPTDYRWLLLEFGAFKFWEEPFLYSLKELAEEYPAFMRNWQEYQEGERGEDLDPFPIGGFGEGSVAVLDRNSGKILMLIHDCADDAPLEDVAGSLKEMVEKRAKDVISWSKEGGQNAGW
jgi:hypothetical protein